MGKYLALWEIDQTRIPDDPKERGAGWSALMAEIGLTKDWGAFVGETSGYAIYEGTELEVMNAIQQYIPFASFHVHPIASVDQVSEMIESLSK
ncbi:MAG: hypothetical protein P8012_15570 [Desulfobacterales bacterium]